MLSVFFSYYYLKTLATYWESLKFWVTKHSFCSPSYDRSIATSKVRSPQTAIYFSFQYLIASFMSSSSCLLLPPRLPVPSIFPSFTCLEGISYTSCDQSSYISFFLLYVGHSFPPWLCVILFQFSYDMPNWSFPSFCSTTFKNFPGVSDVLSKESIFQHHKIVCSKCRIYQILPCI